MANEKPLKAGRYELTVDHYRKTTSKPGQPYTYELYGRDYTDENGQPKVIVDLSAEEAERLRDVIGEPGENQRREAARLRAEAERLTAQAEEREAQAKSAESDAKSAVREAKTS